MKNYRLTYPSKKRKKRKIQVNQIRKREVVDTKKREKGVGGVLTLISLRMTSIMLPITMRKSKTFHGSLK